ncbi:MAG TPA: Fe-Mn family superoxide dismutase [Steroidobacteraceae bacterium]|nr:Fe-Mn family superoxide dismutase [Steroidobacteraceae bacterium]
MAQLRTSAPSPEVREELKYYQPRDFSLYELEGFSSRSATVHLDVYRNHVESVNRLLAAKALAPGDEPRAAGLPATGTENDFAFEYNGMVLHELFFEGLTTALGTYPPPDGAFARAAERSFGSVEAWKKDLRELAKTPRPGWALCALDRSTRRLFNVWVDQHELGLPAHTDPVLVIDLWEHAWIGDFEPAQRGDYIDLMLTQTDWQVIEKRCR